MTFLSTSKINDGIVAIKIDGDWESIVPGSFKVDDPTGDFAAILDGYTSMLLGSTKSITAVRYKEIKKE